MNYETSSKFFIVSLIFIFVIIFVFIKYFSKHTETFISQIYEPSYNKLNKSTLYWNVHEKQNEWISNMLKTDYELEDPKNHGKEAFLETSFMIFPDGLYENIASKDPRMLNYRYMFPIHTLLYTLVVHLDALPTVKSLDGLKKIRNLKIGVVRDTYTEQLWELFIKFMGVDTTFQFVRYTTQERMVQAWEKKEIDGMALMVHHIDEFVKTLSYEHRIRIITWDETKEDDAVLGDTIRFFLSGIESYTFHFDQYRLTSIENNQKGYGFQLCFFAHEKVPADVVKSMMGKYLERDDVSRTIKSSFIGGKPNIRYHSGARAYLSERGLIQTYSGREETACQLLAGKTSCHPQSELLKQAKIFEERDFYYKNNTNTEEEGNVQRFLRETKKKKDTLEETKEDEKYKHINTGGILQNFRGTLNSTWQCFGQTDVRTKKLCESNRDINGSQKVPGVWDKPCLEDTECPFYKKNQNYPNEFGRCISGFCEMPKGVKRIGFRKYDPNDKPLCYGCSKEEYDKGTCCIKKNLMASPDYVFENDKYERIKYAHELQKRLGD